MNYETIILGSWVTFMLVWAFASFNIKRDIKGGSVHLAVYRYFLLKVVGIVLVAFVVLRIATGAGHYTRVSASIFRNGIFTPSPTLGWIAASFVVLGIFFAIWARIHLGRNWSSVPAMKENHELVTSGPYRFVRHPIYTGVIFAAFGTALTGTTFGIVLFLIASVMFYLRMDKEEKIMLELFPNEYPSYQARTKRLLPFIW